MTEIIRVRRPWICPKCGRTFKNGGGHSKVCGTDLSARLFWAKVNKGPHPKGCWLYRGFIKWDGYGWVNRSGQNMTAHRYAWILTHGEPPEGKHLLHTCDVPACCNPEHLMKAKGRQNSSFLRQTKPLLHPDRVRPRRHREPA